MEPTLQQKEETFQVIIDVIKNSTCYKAFTICAEVPEIFMQQFWENVNYPKLIWEDFVVQIDNRKLADMKSYLTPESYQMFIKYSTGLIPPKKSRVKGLQGKKITDSPKETVEVSEESDHEHVKKQTGSRKLRGVVIQDTPSTPKKKSVNHSKKLKGIQTLTLDEQLAADTMQACKNSQKTSRRKPSTGGSNEKTGITPGVPDESTIVFPTSYEGTDDILGVPDELKVTSKAKMIYSNNDEEKKYDVDDDKSIDLENTNNEETDDESLHSDKFVNDDVDEEMNYAKDVDIRKADEENFNLAKEEVEKTKEIKDDNTKAGLPPTSSSLSMSFGFSN
uniref:Uncharacterized protein n=1 Tax=Tanacetum cinerariifolium TaxID=118510 RepID=A0A699JNE8_TANCI|nr:hypothetical protein [Tanacetum cinerariifolium]